MRSAGASAHYTSPHMAVAQVLAQGHWLSTCAVVPVPQRTFFVVPSPDVRPSPPPALMICQSCNCLRVLHDWCSLTEHQSRGSVSHFITTSSPREYVSPSNPT